MGIYTKWKSEMEKKLKEGFDKNKIPAKSQRCPKCFNMTLEYDSRTGRIHCTNCGFEEYLKNIIKIGRADL